jgi:hypothetical protein
LRFGGDDFTLMRAVQAHEPRELQSAGPPGTIRLCRSDLRRCELQSSAIDPLVGRATARPSATPSWLGSLWAASAFLFILSILVRLVDLGQLARFDELYTLLAARGWLNEGVPRIAEGVYARAELYTIFIAGWLQLFGHSLVVARLPSVLFGSLLVIAVFLWTNAVAGRTAAWISGLFVAFASISVEMSQYARFYAPHALIFWLGAVGVYVLSAGQRVTTHRQLAIAVGTILSLVVALYLQVTTLIGISALALWLGVAKLLPFLAQRHSRVWQYWSLLGGLALAVGLVAAAVLASDFGGVLLESYLETPLTVIQHQGEIWFYHLHLIERYPSLWPIFPFLALIAVAARPRPSIFAICVFCVAFILFSFAGHKSWHLLFFMLPFLFVVWAIALASMWAVLRDIVLAATDRVAGHVGSGWQRPLRCGLIAGSIVFLLLANGSSARTLLRPLGIHLGEGFSASWPAAVPELGPWVQEADVVLTSHELHMLYYLGRADIVVSKERLAEFAETEFARDHRTGLPVISRPESLELILDCYPSGVLVTDTIKGWRAPTVIDDQTANLIVARTNPVELPAGSKLMAFQWQTPVDDALPAACAAIPGFSAPAATR